MKFLLKSLDVVLNGGQRQLLFEPRSFGVKFGVLIRILECWHIATKHKNKMVLVSTNDPIPKSSSWCNGSESALHEDDPGSIPGLRIKFYFILFLRIIYE